MKASYSMRQVVLPASLLLPVVGVFDHLGSRVLSLPSLEVCNDLDQRNYGRLRQATIVSKRPTHTSVDDLIDSEPCDQHPSSCMTDPSTVILSTDTSCSRYIISSSHSSSSTSISASDTYQLVQRLTSVYDHQDSQSLLDGDLISCTQIDCDPISSDDSEGLCIPVPSPDASTMRSTPVDPPTADYDDERDDDDDDDDPQTSSSLSPSHQMGVPSKAAAVLGAREVFTSPSHAAYRRLVDFSHRPALDGQSLLAADAPYPPTLVHPSLTARPHRSSKSDTRAPEALLERRSWLPAIGLDDVRERLAFLRRPGDLLSPSEAKTRDADRLMRAAGASPLQVRQWGVSFDQLLHDRYGLALFHEYLKSEYSEENIEFWIACEEYRTLTNSKKMVARAHKIIKDFVATQATKEINLDSKTRQLTLENVHRPDCTMFEVAQRRIQTLMEIDSYQRFLRSAMYQALLQESDGQGSSPGDLGGQAGAVASSGHASESGSVFSLGDVDRSDSCKQAAVPLGGRTSIIRISSVKTPRSDSDPQDGLSGIPPSTSENCLRNTTG